MMLQQCGRGGLSGMQRDSDRDMWIRMLMHCRHGFRFFLGGSWRSEISHGQVKPAAASSSESALPVENAYLDSI